MLLALTRVEFRPCKRFKVTAILASKSADRYLFFFGEFRPRPERLLGLSGRPMTDDACAVSIVYYESLFHFVLAFRTALVDRRHINFWD